jgi:hypothetical protein
MRKPIKLLIRGDIEGWPGLTESVWAQPIAPGLAKLLNVPATTDEYGLHDLVRHNLDNEVTELVEKCSASHTAGYDEGHEDQHEQRFAVVREYLSQHDIPCESMAPGWLGLSVPRDVSAERLAAIAAACPYPLTIE